MVSFAVPSLANSAVTLMPPWPAFPPADDQFLRARTAARQAQDHAGQPYKPEIHSHADFPEISRAISASG